MLICEGMRTDTHSSETKQIITRLQNFLFLNFTHIPLHNFAELSRSLSDPPDQKKTHIQNNQIQNLAERARKRPINASDHGDKTSR